MTGKELVEIAAKRLANEELDASIVDTVAMINREFAPFAELFEAAQRHRERCLCTCDECIGLHEALAAVERLGGNS